jgi:hypothetical protein
VRSGGGQRSGSVRQGVGSQLRPEEAHGGSKWDIRRCDPADTDGSGRQRFSLVGHAPLTPYLSLSNYDGRQQLDPVMATVVVQWRP